MLYTGAFYR